MMISSESSMECPYLAAREFYCGQKIGLFRGERNFAAKPFSDPFERFHDFSSHCAAAMAM
jgi:hypothetical protein